MKRSIFYAGLFSVMALVPAMTEQAFAAYGNASDAVTTSIVEPTIIPWISFPNTPEPTLTVPTPAPDLSIQPPTPGPAPTTGDQESENAFKNKKPKVGAPRH